MDITFINSIGFSSDNAVPQLGLLSLKNVLLKHGYQAEIISFDALNKKSIIRYSDMIVS